ncbi:MAG: phosphodiester glycosidase family protein [Ruminococcaceae bacterium]|nr:phosphodiester glycosidase family protein [Oscillospiraceae bacterium]
MVMRKVLLAVFAACVFATVAFSAPIYKYENTVPVTDAVSLTTVREFHADKNISYSYIKADLTDEKIGLTLLKSSEGTDILDTVENLAATNENTVAALNGDFFSVYSGKKGFSLGIEYQDGILYESPIYPETMASVAYDGESLLMSYFEYELSLTSPEGVKDTVRHVNKHTDYYGDILMYTSSFNGGYSPAPGGVVLEVVVEDNIIVEFRRNMESVKIPENGCVFVVSEGNNMYFANNFNVGDEIVIELNVTPSLEDVKTAFGGGSMLVFEGQDVGKIGDYTHTVAGFNPRSAIGIDEAGTTLYLVAVDGRQTISKGMRMSHLAELMISLGCYYAVNLDGGGSTRLLASTLDNEAMHPVNNPTENRKVINAVGITLEQTENAGEPCGIYLFSDKEYAFVGQPVELSAYLYDDSMRRVSLFEEEIVYECDKGTIEDGVLYCDNGGTVTVTAKYEDLSAEIIVDFIDDICGIETIDTLSMKKDEEYQIKLNVFDEAGRNVVVDDYSRFDITSSNPDVADIDENGLITAKDNGISDICIEKNGVVSVINISVGFYEYDYHFGFETNEGRLVTYPDTVKGDFEITDENKFSEKFAGKISFDFRSNDDGMCESEVSDEYEGLFEIVEDYEHEKDGSDDSKDSEDTEDVSQHIETADIEEEPEDVAKAVYYELEKGIRVSDDCDTIYMNVFFEDDFKHSVRAQFTDANGKIAIVPFTGDYEIGSWRGYAAYIPEEVSRPLTLTRVYVLYMPGEEKDKGSIYIDDLFFKTSNDYIPNNSNRNSFISEVSNSNVEATVRIGTLPLEDKATPLSNVVKNRVKRILDESDVGLLVGKGSSKGITQDDYNIYVTLDTSKGGIRNTDSEQWIKLYEAITQSEKQNVFILTDNSIFGDDEFENDVIRDFLATCGKNVFVVTCGNSSTYKNINGVQYFTLDNTPDNNFDGMISNCNSIIEFSIGDTVTFEFLSV